MTLNSEKQYLIYIHTSHFTKQYFSKSGLNVLFNSPYNCEINFIEYIFGHLYQCRVYVYSLG